VLVVLDGWGVRAAREGNAIALAGAPFYHGLLRDYPATELTASGESVGLPADQMGNSEVGHLNLGAGRVVYQDFTRINRAIADGSFAANPVLLAAIDAARLAECRADLAAAERMAAPPKRRRWPWVVLGVGAAALTREAWERWR
jgi:2,3-bisphosphoglycerate-independent phosphoglycerate mutase